MASLESVFLKTSIRAMAYKKPILLSSSGSFVSVWDERRTFKCSQTFPIEIQQTIIGIKFEDHNLQCLPQNSTEEIVLIYSTQFIVFCLLNIQHQNENVIKYELKQIYKANLVYWIIDCVFGNGLAYILNSRNEVLIYDLNKQEIITRIFGPQKCILYSGMFVSYSHDWLVVASGTVFRTVLLWSIEANSDRHWQMSNIQALEGHDGVIFSIDYNSSHNILISASDDRSIRIWTGNVPKFDSRNLGFWKENLFCLSKIYYGHSARIWKVASSLLPTPIIVSAGEDASIIIWSLLPPYSIVQKKSLFRNNRIWCFEVLQNCIAFGGSDSSIKFIDIDDLLDMNQFSLDRKHFKVPLPKAICYLLTDPSSHRLFTCSIKGNFHLVDDENILKKIELDDNLFLEKMEAIFSDYYCLDTNFQRTKTVIASKFGHIGLLAVINDQLKLVYLSKLFASKVFDISFVSEDHFICCLSTGQVSLFSIEGQSVQLKEMFVLPVTRHPWSSCGVLIKNALIVGDFSGNVFAFVAKKSAPLFEYRQIHGPNGVTAIMQKPHSDFVYSSGRNGKIIEFLIVTDRTNGELTSLQLLRTFAVFPEMEWIGGFQFETVFPFSIKYVYGFESKNFLLWDWTESRIVFHEECGGGHRSWDLVIDSHVESSRNIVKFSYTKKDNVQSVQRELPALVSPLTETYSSLPRKINSCAQLYSSNKFAYFLLGGEDTFMQVIRLDFQKHCILPLTTLYGHISNITSIRCLARDRANGEQIIDAVSVGGRSQLMVWKFTVTSNEELICQEQASNFLGIFDQHLHFEERIRKATKEVLPLVDIRYLHVDLLSIPDSEGSLLILVACSDCSFRLYQYDDSKKSIVHSEKVSTGNSCFLNSKFLFLDTPIDQNVIYQSNIICALASTDGHLCLWPTNKEWNDGRLTHNEPIVSLKLHQAGINSMDFRLVQNMLLVLTGGDDNAIKVTTMLVNKSSPSNYITILTTVEETSIHTCQITGLRFVSDSTFVSASIDQKIISWKVSLSSENPHQLSPMDAQLMGVQFSISPIDSQISAVADISSMVLVSHKCDNFALVCGEGLELVKV